MAMVKLDSMIEEINGRSGGDVWRRDQCGQHVQKQPRKQSNQPTPTQKKRRRAWQSLMTIVRRCFSPEVAAYWQDYANQHTRKNKKGETITLTWWNMFISFNINKVVAGEDPDLIPPGYELTAAVPTWCEQFL